MNCVLFDKMDKVFSLKKNKTLNKILENKNNAGKVREFCKSEKVATIVSIGAL